MQAWRPPAQRVATQALQQPCFYRLMPVDVDGATGLPCVEPGESLLVLGGGTMEPSQSQQIPAQWLPAAAFAQPAPRSAFGPFATAAPQYARAPQLDFAASSADMLARTAALAGASGVPFSSSCMLGEYSAAVEPAHFMSMLQASTGSVGQLEGFTR